MKRFMHLKALMAVLLIGLLPFMAACDDDDNGVIAQETAPKYVIFMVPDGMGLSNVTAARIYKNGPDGGALALETLEYIGYQRTHSRNSTVTDSAAAASAWACGEKFNNGEISCLDNNEDGICDGTRAHEKTILETAKDLGMATGLVANSDITHATPAAFGAHVHNRKCESEIFRQYMEKSIDVLLGGGIATNRSSCLLEGTDDAYNDALVQQAIQNGYTYVTNQTELLNAGNASRLLGVFNSGGMTPIFARGAANTEPTLAEMTNVALDVLEENANGFFLMVEGSQIDWANHARNAVYQIQETLDFDNSVKVAMDWMNASQERKDNTLLVVVADHECGGVIIDGPYGRLSQAGNTSAQYVDGFGQHVEDNDGYPVMAPDVDLVFGSGLYVDGVYENIPGSANHTAVDTIVWSNSPALAKAMDNADIYGVIYSYLTN